MEIINYVGNGAAHASDKTLKSRTSTAAKAPLGADRTIYRTGAGLSGRPASRLGDRTATLSSYRSGTGQAASLGADRTAAGLRSRTSSALGDRTATLSVYRSTAGLAGRTSTLGTHKTLSGSGLRTSTLSSHRTLGGSTPSLGADRTAGGSKSIPKATAASSVSVLQAAMGATPMAELLGGEKTGAASAAAEKKASPTVIASMAKAGAAPRQPIRTGTVLSREMIKETTSNTEGAIHASAMDVMSEPSGDRQTLHQGGRTETAKTSARAATARSPLAFIGQMASALHRALGGAAAFATAAVIGSILVMGADWYASHTGPLALQDGSTAELDALSFIMECSGVDSVTDTVSHPDTVDELHELAQTAVPVIKSVVTWQTYSVSPGDTIIGLTRRFGLTNISTIIAINGVDNARAIRSGQKLRIPSMDGLVYTVKAGNTLEGISSKYSVSMEDILDVNDLATKDLAPGQEIFIPGAAMDNTALREAMGDLFKCPIRVSYRVSSHFGWRADPFTGVRSYHSGVDMACPMGSSIFAAMGGKVITAGWSNVFGNYVIVDHQNGYQSLYGHMSKRIARKGQVVNQGDLLGLVGSTGYSTGPHLHFTVYKRGRLTDPMVLLKR